MTYNQPLAILPMRARYKAAYRLIRMIAKGVIVDHAPDWKAEDVAAHVMEMRELTPKPNAVERRASAIEAAKLLWAIYESEPKQQSRPA